MSYRAQWMNERVWHNPDRAYIIKNEYLLLRQSQENRKHNIFNGLKKYLWDNDIIFLLKLHSVCVYVVIRMQFLWWPSWNEFIQLQFIQQVYVIVPL